jgi:Icc-related predicted phosphoesterase
LAIKLIADPHGCFEGLTGNIASEDILIILGDVLDLVDWSDISGILPDIMGRDHFITRLQAALAGGPEEGVALRNEIISPHGGYYDKLLRRVSEQYGRLSEVLGEIGCRAYLIYGNGDIPELMRASLDGKGKVTIAGGKVEIEGSLFGFVPGALYSPFRMPSEMDDEQYGRMLRELGRVDVLCTHIPPQTEAATMDVVAGKPVLGSNELLAYLEENRPRILYHGHVHQPAQRELLIGGTRVINVGYYKKERYVHVHGEEDGV